MFYSCGLFPRLGIIFSIAAMGGLCLSACTALKSRPHRNPEELTPEESRFADALAHYCQGLVNRELLGEDYPATLRHYKEASRLDPDNAMLHSLVGLTACRQKEPNTELAIEHFKRAIELDPENPALYVSLARLYFYMDMDATALQTLQTGMRKSESHPVIKAMAYGYARLFISRDEHNRAVPCVKFLAEHSSKKARYNHLLAQLYLSLEDSRNAAKYYRLAIDSENPIADSYMDLASIYAEKHPSKAEKVLLKARNIFPENTEVLLLLARFYAVRNETGQALETYEQLRRTVENMEGRTLSADVYLEYGATCDRAGRRDLAEKIFKECIGLYPRAHSVLNYLAYMWAEDGVNLAEANRLVLRALELKPDDGAYIDTLGWIFYKQKKFSEALVMILKAHTLMGGDPVILDHLGDVLNALGRTEEAVERWKESFRLDPDNNSVAEKLEKKGVDLGALTSENASSKETKSGDQ